MRGIRDQAVGRQGRRADREPTRRDVRRGTEPASENGVDSWRLVIRNRKSAVHKLMTIARNDQSVEMRKVAVRYSRREQGSRSAEVSRRAFEIERRLISFNQLWPCCSRLGASKDDESPNSINRDDRAELYHRRRRRPDEQVEAAQTRARTRQTPYWSAYTFDVRPGVAIDPAIREFRGNMNTIGDTTVFVGTDASGMTVETRSLAIFLLRDPAANQITRMEIYNLERKREYSGYPVYWLGRANNEESLNYLRALAAAIAARHLE